MFWEDIESGVSCGGITLVISEFIDFWHEEMDDMDFVQYFISPDLRWKYREELSIMKKEGSRTYIDSIIKDIECKLRYVFLMEVGLLDYLRIPYEADDVLIIGFLKDDIFDAVNSLKSQLNFQPEISEENLYHVFIRMVVGFLLMVKQKGCFSKTRDKEMFCEYILKYWSDENKKAIDPELVLECMLKAVSRLVCPYPLADNSDADSFIINEKSVHLSADRDSYKCEACGRIYYVPYENTELMEDIICLSPGCNGKLEFYSEKKSV